MLTGAIGEIGAVAAATCPLTVFGCLAGRLGWGFLATGAETVFTGATETFFAGAAFGGALLILDGLAAGEGASLVAFLAGALLFAIGAFFAAGLDAAFFTGFFAAVFGLAFFATGFAAFLAGDFLAAAIWCLPRPTSVGGERVSVRGTLPAP